MPNEVISENAADKQLPAQAAYADVYGEIRDNLISDLPRHTVKEPCRNLEKALLKIDPKSGEWVPGLTTGPQSLIFRITHDAGQLTAAALSETNYFALKTDNEPAALVLIKVAAFFQGADHLFRSNVDISWLLYALLQEPISGNNSEKVRFDFCEGVVWKSIQGSSDDPRGQPHRLASAGLIGLQSSDLQLPSDLALKIGISYGEVTEALAGAIKEQIVVDQVS